MCSMLYPQLTRDVEVIAMIDNGTVNLSKKINMLHLMASGKYLALLNDDDVIPRDYVSYILEAAKSDADILLGEIHQWWNTWKYEDVKVVCSYENVIPAKSELVRKYCVYDEGEGAGSQDSRVSAKLAQNTTSVHNMNKPIYYHLRRDASQVDPYIFEELKCELQ